ncbi:MULTISPECIES: type 1 glutamine amidotransferase [unclassified Ornithinimicrobium]|uniref:type 1 glutamine amidotransferase n=1 Tax=unclassified Ornithinimicrobium TaxID=2615080 RepID=UPI00385411F3
MSPLPRALVVQHEDTCPVGLLEPWLRRVGLDCDVLAAHRGRALPAALVDHVALVVLGGQMGADDEAEHRWLLPTKALIGATVAAGLPFLGVCLGHQLATVALGGQVRPNPTGSTRAITPFAPTAAGRLDELTGLLAPGSRVLHWNDDVAVRLPRRAVVLATAPDGTPQAVRFGPRAWGVQFHPEVDADIVAGWHGGRRSASEESELVALRRHQNELHRDWQMLVQRFGRIALDPESIGPGWMTRRPTAVGESP